MPSYVLNVNGRRHTVNVAADTPLLWVLRDALQLTDTKFGCGIGQCGACTVRIAGQPVRSCGLPIAAVGQRSVVTIEGLSSTGLGQRLQAAWVRHQVPQCGYCQSGQLMTAVALLEKQSAPSDRDIDAAMTNICRCGTYARIRAALHDVAGDSAATSREGGTP